MPVTAHTFTPRSNKFEDRVRACKSVLESYQSAVASKVSLHDAEWSRRLGSPEEVDYAYEVARNSMGRASASLEMSELYYAKEQGLLSKEDVEQLSEVKEKAFPNESPEIDLSDDFDGPDF